VRTRIGSVVSATGRRFRAVTDRAPVNDRTVVLARRSLEVVAGIAGRPWSGGAGYRSQTFSVDGRQLHGEWVRARTETGELQDDRQRDRVILYLHGGVYTMGSPRTHRPITSRLAVITDVPVFALDYRRAPEHRHPAALDDALAAFAWLSERFGSIDVAGDSAGGHLALGLCLTRECEGLPGPRRMLLMSPVTDPTFTLARQADAESLDPLIPLGPAQEAVALYLGPVDPSDQAAFPLTADLGALPPTMIQCGGAEFWRADSMALAERMRDAGAEVTLSITPGHPHVFQAVPAFPAARLALRSAGEFLRSR
jgi:monoterpene epsilon-lactone hydrolase